MVETQEIPKSWIPVQPTTSHQEQAEALGAAAGKHLQAPVMLWDADGSGGDHDDKLMVYDQDEIDELMMVNFNVA